MLASRRGHLHDRQFRKKGLLSRAAPEFLPTTHRDVISTFGAAGLGLVAGWLAMLVWRGACASGLRWRQLAFSTSLWIGCLALAWAYGARAGIAAAAGGILVAVAVWSALIGCLRYR
jgi:hypothetical protein